jgi:voltage-gated potassium channel
MNTAALNTAAINLAMRDAQISLPKPAVRPLQSVLRRVELASLLLGATVLLVYIDRGGYRDAAGGALTFIDCVYYTTVTLSTTGYGDIVPIAESARLVNALVITPLRVMFLIILVGTTLEVLTERTRQEWRLGRWRKQLNDHVVIIGFGTKGRSAATTLLNNGSTLPTEIVVVDQRPEAISAANALGLTAVLGDGTRTEVLTQARVAGAKTVVIAPRGDDTAVLATLTVRQLNPSATVVVTVREEENAPLVRQSGANTVITSSDTAGQLLGVSTISPRVGEVMMDLLAYGEGLDIVERPADKQDVGLGPRTCREPVLAVVRGSRLLRFDDPVIGDIELTDRLIVVRGNTRGSSPMREGSRVEP